METLQKIALVFTIIGAIVWGLIGLFDFNLVEFILVTIAFYQESFILLLVFVV